MTDIAAGLIHQGFIYVQARTERLSISKRLVVREDFPDLVRLTRTGSGKLWHCMRSTGSVNLTSVTV